MTEASFRERAEEERVLFEQRIAIGENRLTRQMLRIEQLRAMGRDVTRAERLLQEFRIQLAEWHATREGIRRVAQSYELLCRSEPLIRPAARTPAPAPKPDGTEPARDIPPAHGRPHGRTGPVKQSEPSGRSARRGARLPHLL